MEDTDVEDYAMDYYYVLSYGMLNFGNTKKCTVKTCKN